MARNKEIQVPKQDEVVSINPDVLEKEVTIPEKPSKPGIIVEQNRDWRIKMGIQ